MKIILKCFCGFLAIFLFWFCFFAFAPASATAWVLFWGESYQRVIEKDRAIDDCLRKTQDGTFCASVLGLSN